MEVESCQLRKRNYVNYGNKIMSTMEIKLTIYLYFN